MAGIQGVSVQEGGDMPLLEALRQNTGPMPRSVAPMAPLCGLEPRLHVLTAMMKHN